MRFFQPQHKGILSVSKHMRFMRIAVMFLRIISQSRWFLISQLHLVEVSLEKY